MGSETTAPSRPPVDWLIVNGTVFDGLGNDGVVGAAVAVEGGRLRVLPPGEPRPPARRVHDAHGQYVCPGFIDIHSHSDFAGLAFPLAQSKVLAGVTTELNGNCGMSAFPLGGELLARRRADYARGGVHVTWTDAAGYHDVAQTVGSSLHRGILVGHGNLRAMTVGYANRPADRGERLAMAGLLEAALANGQALGLSSGLYYAPGRFADADELCELTRVVAHFGGLYASHLRSEDDGLLEAVAEFFEVLTASGARGQLSHIKTSLPRNWHKILPLRDELFARRAAGVNFAVDRYPYTSLCTALEAVLLPAWALADGHAYTPARLRDPDARARIIDDMITRHPDAEFLDAVVITAVQSPANAGAIGGSLRAWGATRDQDPLTAALDLLAEEDGRVECIHFAMSEDNLVEILRWPFTLIGSDHSVRAAVGPLRSGARPHPRAYGTPSRFLTEYVRRRRLMSWGQGIHRMTGACAAALGLTDRGTLTDGAWADVVVFDPVTLTDRASYSEPRLPPTGISLVLVNGQAVVEAGYHTGRRPGFILQR